MLCSRSQVTKAYEGVCVCSGVSNDASQTSPHRNMIITQGKVIVSPFQTRPSQRT